MNFRLLYYRLEGDKWVESRLVGIYPEAKARFYLYLVDFNEVLWRLRPHSSITPGHQLNSSCAISSLKLKSTTASLPFGALIALCGSKLYINWDLLIFTAPKVSFFFFLHPKDLHVINEMVVNLS